MQKILLDVDTGIDDALAIAYILAQQDVELLGITTSYGMAPLNYTFRNTKKVLQILNQQIPVYKGARKPKSRLRNYDGIIHGLDGLGETLKEDYINKYSSNGENATNFIINQVDKYEEDLMIITTGPFTNLANAFAKKPDIIRKVGKVISMGGAVATPGNASKFAESNVYIDPEAANIILQSNLPLTLVGLDVTRKALLSQEDVHRWKKINTTSSIFFAKFTNYYLNSYQNLHPYLNGKAALHDPLAVSVAINPDIVTTVPMFLKVDLEQNTLGRTIEDISLSRKNDSATFVSLQVNAQKFLKDFFQKIESMF